MSTNKTQHYQLHSWAAEDKFLRGEMNENFTAIDTAIKQAVTAAAQAVQGEANARASAVSALQTALAGKVGVVTGSYTGDAARDRTISLGFTPKAVLIMLENGYMGTSSNHMGGLAGEGLPCRLQLGSAGYYDIINLVTNGFQVHYQYWSGSPGTTRGTNTNGNVYHYLAVR